MIDSLKLLSIALSLACSGSFACNSNSKDVSGIYVNKNYSYGPLVADIPYVADTLTLADNNTFYSEFYGRGDYEVREGKIEIYYTYEFGSARFIAPLEKRIFGGDRIVLYRDMDHFYEKISN